MLYLPRSSGLTFCRLTVSNVLDIPERMMFPVWFCLLWRPRSCHFHISLVEAWAMAEA